MRLLEMATLKTEGARYVKAVWPCGWAWLWTFQGMCQTCGSIWDKRAAWWISSVKSAREMGESALTGTKKWARGGTSAHHPPPKHLGRLRGLRRRSTRKCLGKNGAEYQL